MTPPSLRNGFLAPPHTQLLNINCHSIGWGGRGGWEESAENLADREGMLYSRKAFPAGGVWSPQSALDASAWDRAAVGLWAGTSGLLSGRFQGWASSHLGETSTGG